MRSRRTRIEQVASRSRTRNEHIVKHCWTRNEHVVRRVSDLHIVKHCWTSGKRNRRTRNEPVAWLSDHKVCCRTMAFVKLFVDMKDTRHKGALRGASVYLQECSGHHCRVSMLDLQVRHCVLDGGGRGGGVGQIGPHQGYNGWRGAT